MITLERLKHSLGGKATVDYICTYLQAYEDKDIIDPSDLTKIIFALNNLKGWMELLREEASE